jgi:hypothetical protein
MPPDEDEDEDDQPVQIFLDYLNDPRSSGEDKFAAVSFFRSVSSSIGSCALDGGDLHFEGRAEGLVVACVLDVSHRWKPTGERIT